MRIYLAAPRFSLAERRLNEEFARILERCYMPLEVILPQTGPATAPDSAESIHRAINRSDAVVAILNGDDTGSHTYIEMRYAKGKGKLVIGVRTEFPASKDLVLNQVLSGACTVLIVRNRVAMSLDDLAEEIADLLARHERPNAPGYVAFPHVAFIDREIA